MLISSGYIAQEIQTVLTDENVTYTGIVDSSDSDNLTVSKAALVPMLVNAIKELSARVEELESRQ